MQAIKTYFVMTLVPQALWTMTERFYQCYRIISVEKFGFWILSLVSWRFDALSCRSITNVNRDLRIVCRINKRHPEFKNSSPLHFNIFEFDGRFWVPMINYAVLGKMWIYHQYANVLGRQDIENRQFFTWFYNAANFVYQVYTSKSLSAYLLNNHWTLNTKRYIV